MSKTAFYGQKFQPYNKKPEAAHVVSLMARYWGSLSKDIVWHRTKLHPLTKVSEEKLRLSEAMEPKWLVKNWFATV